MGELNCVACHSAPPAITTRLHSKPAPLLDAIAGRVRPEYLRDWILDPAATKPGATMPDLLHGLPVAERVRTADDLVHFLLVAATAQTQPGLFNRLTAEQGKALYHRVGCVACHAPREAATTLFADSPGPNDPDTVRFVMKKLEDSSVPLGNVAVKYTVAALEEFLLNPLASRPGGRMPSLNLTTNEARAIATYLVRSSSATPLPAAPKFVVEPARVARGRQAFESLGCAACHALARGQPPLESTLAAKPLLELTTNRTAACCLSPTANAAPRYQLSAAQREAIWATLSRAGELAQPLSPERQVSRHLTILNCFACHARAGAGGPTPSRSDYFTTVNDADLGDEGRRPPHLNEVGSKLRPEWFGQVLTNHGAVRPYMAVRMPQYGATNVAPLVAAFAQADPPAPSGSNPRPAVAGDVAAGRELVGADGLQCISCHRFGARKSLGIDVMDMTQMAKRLQPEWFRRYLLDPASLRPGTRMPMFWSDGEASLKTILGGDTERQIESIWRYLSQGTNAIPPEMIVPALVPAPKKTAPP